MATKPFLTLPSLQDGDQLLEPIKGRLTNPFENNYLALGLQVSQKIGQELEQRFRQNPHWDLAQPIALGSWARDELCIKSDIDLLFCGDKASAHSLIADLQKEGWPIRTRIPIDLQDWSVGIEDFDILSLLGARAFNWDGGVQLEKQQEALISQGPKTTKRIFKSIIDERKARHSRYDSITNYLEPNIKYGPGGLRDLQQGLLAVQLFPSQFVDAYQNLNRLKQLRDYLICLRHWLHFNGYSDLLVASSQRDLSEWCGYESLKDFMRDFQNALSEVKFVTDWIFQRVKSSQKQIAQMQAVEFSKLHEVPVFFANDSSVLAQEKVRQMDERIFKFKNKTQVRQFGKALYYYFDLRHKEEFFESLFRSNYLSRLVPELEIVTGLVQHDQYHRYTVETHILQLIKGLLRAEKNPKKQLGKFAKIFLTLTEEEKKILLWSAFFHDLAKGQKTIRLNSMIDSKSSLIKNSTGKRKSEQKEKRDRKSTSTDHSTLGAELVKKYFTQFGFSLRMTLEVSWLVQNHLLLSRAAFRNNPKSKETWSFLYDKGVKGRRVDLLSLLTILDIKATNPEAWTDWKEDLMLNLVDTLKSRPAKGFLNLLTKAEKLEVQLSSSFIEGLSEEVIEEIPTHILLEDYQSLQNSKVDLPVRLYKVPGESMYWIRFHRKKDKEGLFLYFVQGLYATGCQIQQCSIQTFPKLGVYDWFKVTTSKKPTQLKKLFNLVEPDKIKVPEIKFTHVELFTEQKDLSIISFRGKDTAGALLAAVESLYCEGLVVRWAKAHTWGRQIEDVFAVENSAQINLSLERIRKRLL